MSKLESYFWFKAFQRHRKGYFTFGPSLTQKVTFGAFEMHDCVIIFEEINFVNTRDRLSSTLSQGSDNLIVTSGGGGLGNSFFLS